MVIKKGNLGSLLGLSSCLLLCGALFPVWALPQTQDLKGEVLDDKNQPIVEASCTLTGQMLPQQGITATTGEKGEFRFSGLLAGTYDMKCAALGYEPVAQRDLEVTETGAPFVQVVLRKEVIVKEHVVVRAKAPTISAETTAPPATLSSAQLTTLPLVEQKFKAALSLVPGVVRTPDGKINIKGSVETQGMLLVDSAEAVEPVSGSFSIEVPIDAIESVEVHKNAYQAEYGRFSGGLTIVHTQAPSNRWQFGLNDFLPTPRIKSGHIVGIANESPRVRLSGPLWRNKLNFSESFVYDLNRQPVRGLPWPRNEIKKNAFDSYTDFQFFFSSKHLLATNVKLFPHRLQFANISSLVPQSASSDYRQRGLSAGVTDRYMSAAGGILTTLFQYTNFSSGAHGQGPEEMLVTPNGWEGNYFNSWTRDSHQEQLLETYQFPHKRWYGRHDLKVGGDFVHRFYTGTSVSRPVLLRRLDGILAARVDFSPRASLSARDAELAGFIQNHWAFNDRLALDIGLRYSGQTLGGRTAFAPRMGLAYSPGEGGRTIVRAGVGLFYDRVPLLAGDFTGNPTRAVTFFDGQGSPLAPPIVYRNACVQVGENGMHVISPRGNLGSTPYNLTWNTELNREIRPHVVLRLNFLSSRTYRMFIIDPQQVSASEGILLLTNTGAARYYEFESTVRMRPREHVDLNISYVRSLARGHLNSLSLLYVPFEQPVIRPNAYANLPSNVPHRLIGWGSFRIPWKITASPVVDWHSGFPYSAVDVLQMYVGEPNSRRLPVFLSLDMKLSKDFRLPFIPWVKNRTLRGSLAIYNITNHSNPRDVYNNVTSPYFGQFVGFQHRFIDTFLDILY